MPLDPELLQPIPQPELPAAAATKNGFSPASDLAPIAPPPRRRIPHLGHALLFLFITGVMVILTEIAAFTIALGAHLFGPEPVDKLIREPRLLVPSMAFSYLLAALVIWAVFTRMWRRPFSAGVHWNSALVRRRIYYFLGIGVLLSIAIQFLSNYLPIPKTLPINDFFRKPGDVWLVALFGTFLAPLFEELAFRGFLLPALATAWDWITRRRPASPSGDLALPPDDLPGGPVDPEPVSVPPAQLSLSSDPAWSIPALVFGSILTSIAFALLHADQLAHAWAPLAVLFTVSVILCAVRLRTHSLAASTLVHATYNFTIFVALFIGTDGFRHLDKIKH